MHRQRDRAGRHQPDRRPAHGGLQEDDLGRPGHPLRGQHPKILPVDWKALTQYGIAATNYQIFPGDRIFVHSDPLIQTNSFLNKLLSPVERMLGTVLLGATTITAVKTASH